MYPSPTLRSHGGPRRPNRSVKLLLVGALLVAACSGGERSGTTFGSATTTTLPEADPVVITGDFNNLGLEGTPAILHRSRAATGFLAFQDALDLFAAIYGDVPGADRSVSSRGRETARWRYATSSVSGTS